MLKQSHNFGGLTAFASSIELISRGRKVVQTEANALHRLAGTLDEGFAQAARTILAAPMRVVVTGMGKSGHVARKIAATLAATGSPAIFVHPAEAAHGDLGMMMPGDVLLVLSNSGKTAELREIMHYARALGCKIIGIASQMDSSVMRGSDVCILLPDAREACPVNIAPTTSTTMMLALGDALAVTVMGLRGISRESLQLLHPGGSIGLRLLPVREFMRSGDALPLVAPSTPMREVLLTITQKSLGIAGVIDDAGQLIGVITDGDLRRHIDLLLTLQARDVMTASPKTIDHSAPASDAIKRLAQSKITALFVIDNDAPGIPVGIVHIHDFNRAGIA